MLLEILQLPWHHPDAATEAGTSLSAPQPCITQLVTYTVY